MSRRLFGPVRQAALEAAEAAKATAEHLDDVASQSLLKLTAKATEALAAVCEVLDEISDGVSLTVTVMGKEMPVQIHLNIKEKDSK